MRARENTTGPFVFLLVLSALLAGLLAGCGGQGQSGNGDSQGQREDGAANGNGGEKAEKKIALGTIRAVKPDKGRISLKPASEAQSDEPLAFKVAGNTDITLDGEKAEIGDINGGQQAQIEYVGGGGVKRAKSVQLFQGGGQAEN